MHKLVNMRFLYTNFKAIAGDNAMWSAITISTTGIINSSLRQGIVPDQWRITLIPKVFPPKDVESDVRPIVVTNTLAKIAEKFVCEYFNDFYDTHTDINQFGCVHNRSTTHALLKVMP